MAESAIHLSNYDAYGFDIDHTLAKYNLPELFKVFSKCLAQDLIDKRGYDSRILREFDPDFCALRGVIFDIKKGNFFKVSSKGTVLHASHGTTVMDAKEITRHFPPNRSWPRYAELLKKVDNLGKDEFRIFENFFDTPILMVAAHLVDYQDDANGGVPLEEYTFYQDLKDSIKHLYCEFPDSSFFKEWLKDTKKFLQPCTEDLKKWMKKQKADGKVVFALTSSVPLFMQASMEFILGKDWRSYFNVVIASSGKPKFFSDQKEFKKLDKDLLPIEQPAELNDTDLFVEGSITELMKYIKKCLGKKDEPRVLYFGDSLRSDIAPLKQHKSWKAVMVLEELVTEQHEPRDSQDPVNSSQPAPKIRRRDLVELSEEEKKYSTSQRWGSYFRSSCKADEAHLVGLDPASRDGETLWMKILEDNSDLIVPSVDYLIGASKMAVLPKVLQS